MKTTINNDNDSDNSNDSNQNDKVSTGSRSLWGRALVSCWENQPTEPQPEATNNRTKTTTEHKQIGKTEANKKR